MNMNEYQTDSHNKNPWHPRGSKTKNTTDEVAYNTIALCNEAGEFADIVKKSMRGDYEIDRRQNTARAAALELGDVLWYLARLADELGFTLEQVAAMNLGIKFPGEKSCAKKTRKRFKNGSRRGSRHEHWRNKHH